MEMDDTRQAVGRVLNPRTNTSGPQISAQTTVLDTDLHGIHTDSTPVIPAQAGTQSEPRPTNHEPRISTAKYANHAAWPSAATKGTHTHTKARRHEEERIRELVQSLWLCASV